MALEDIVGPQQIFITSAFLGAMLLLLYILRSKSKVIRETIKGSRRINLIEEASLSPTERLRLIEIDDAKFAILSSKAHPPIVCQISQNPASSDRRTFSNDEKNLNELEPQLQPSKAVDTTSNNLTSKYDDDALARKIQNWRHRNAGV